MAAHNKTAHGITITFGTSAFSAEILDVTPPATSIADIKTSHMGTADGYHTYVPADLVDNGQLTFDIAFEADNLPPIDGALETVTIAFPGGTSNSFKGYVNSYAPKAPMEDRMTGTIGVKVSGPIA